MFACLQKTDWNSEKLSKNISPSSVRELPDQWRILVLANNTGIASGPNREVLLSFSQTHFAPSRLFFILIYVFKMYVKRYQRDAFLFLLEHDEREREYPLQSVASDLYIISVWRYILYHYILYFYI